MGGGAVRGTKVEGSVERLGGWPHAGKMEGARPRVPGGEVTCCPFQGQPGLLAAGGAAAGRDGAALWLLPAPGAAAVPRGDAGRPGEGGPQGRREGPGMVGLAFLSI